MKKNTKILTLASLFLGAASLATASMSSPQQINRDARVQSDREVVMTTVEISDTAMSTPRGPAYINRHARVSSDRQALITETPETTQKVTDVAMDGPTASQLNRHN